MIENETKIEKITETKFFKIIHFQVLGMGKDEYQKRFLSWCRLIVLGVLGFLSVFKNVYTCITFGIRK